jgi:hypothetical protein
MPLALYRRHERKKNRRRCECPIFVSGTIGKDIRHQTREGGNGLMPRQLRAK